jgi:hypothetical protein
MAWIHVIKVGLEVEWQTIPPGENMYDFAARFIGRRGTAANSETYVLDDGLQGRSSPMTADRIRELQHLLGTKC